MTLPQNVEDALKLMDGCISTLPEGNKRDWQTIRAHLLSQEAELKILRVKCSGTLANNLCPDHRDKQVGNPCLACTIEKLQSRLAAAKAEIEQLQAGLAKHVNRVCELQSRLAFVDALLSRCFVQIGELTKGLDPHDPIYVELQQLSLDWTQHSMRIPPHLSENTHDRA